MRELPTPEPGADAAVRLVADHFGHLTAEAATADLSTSKTSMSSLRGGQRAADAALASFDVTGYASRRNEVLPHARRGASRLSPYIRHGLLPLSRVWDAVAGGPDRDVTKFRDELLWQEYARHWYSRLGTRTQSGVRQRLPATETSAIWDRSMRCIDSVMAELETDGWLVNQTRMWLASHWAIRLGGNWRAGEDEMFRHLIDGSRAANRLGWQWTTGVGSAKHYGFNRSQVEKRAPGLCQSCRHEASCPIQDWPDEPTYETAAVPVQLKAAANLRMTAGPSAPESTGEPDAVWITAESLGNEDPALAAHPDLPVVFVFDEPLLARLRLSAKRLVFLVETLSEIDEGRELRLYLGSPTAVLRSSDVAATFAPVPGFRRIAGSIKPVALHPWPWLRRPTTGPVASFSAWRRDLVDC